MKGCEGLVSVERKRRKRSDLGQRKKERNWRLSLSGHSLSLRVTKVLKEEES